MNTRRLAALLLTVGFLLVSLPSYAHHSTAMFDMDRESTVKGVVTSFEWTNPHAYVYVDVKDDKGNVEQWTAETAGPLALLRAGWNRTILKPGDQITLSGHPTKDGRKFMHIVKIVLPDGKEIAGGEPPTSTKP